MRKVLIIILIIFVPSLAFSHRGRTDAKGGHYNRKTGEYHCHKAGCKDKNSSTESSFFSTKSGYNRKNWPHWNDEDGDCQNTRAEILIQYSLEPVKFKRTKGCVVAWGKWVGSYTGEVFTKASDLDIDHIVPLAHSYRTGGANWTRNQKRTFANDPENLLPVDDATNQSKSDKSPVDWKPPLKTYWCEYAKKWKRIKTKYSLHISTLEDRNLHLMEKTCE